MLVALIELSSLTVYQLLKHAVPWFTSVMHFFSPLTMSYKDKGISSGSFRLGYMQPSRENVPGKVLQLTGTYCP